MSACGGSIIKLKRAIIKMPERSDFHHYSLFINHYSFLMPVSLPILIKCRIFPLIWSRRLCQEKSGSEFKFLIKSDSFIVTVQGSKVLGSGVQPSRWRWSCEFDQKRTYWTSNIEWMNSVYFIKRTELSNSKVRNSAVLRFAVQPLNLWTSEPLNPSRYNPERWTLNLWTYLDIILNGESRTCERLLFL